MLTSFQVRKFTRMFNALDINSDGALDAEDVELVVGRHATESAGRAEPAHLATLEAAYRAWYGGIIQMADHNQDGKVTLEEFLGFQENLMKDAALYEQIIGESGSLPWKRVRNICIQLCHALQAAPRRVKPHWGQRPA